MTVPKEDSAASYPPRTQATINMRLKALAERDEG